MEVCSTRDAGVRLSFSASLLAGLPPGGGLYQPCPPPDLTDVIAALPDEVPFADLAAAMTEALLGRRAGRRRHSGARGGGRSLSFAPALSAPRDSRRGGSS